MIRSELYKVFIKQHLILFLFVFLFLNAAYHIGGSYFSKLQLYLNEEHTNKKSAYRHLWENHLKGVLFEYLRGTANAMENLKMLESVYYNENGNNDIEG